MALTITAGSSGVTELVDTYGTSDPFTIDWRVFKNTATLGTSATPNGYAVTPDGLVTVPIGAPTGTLGAEVFLDEPYEALPRQYSRYSFEVVCLSARLTSETLGYNDGVWTVKILANLTGGVAPFGYTWNAGGSPVVAGGGSNNYLTIQLDGDDIAHVSLVATAAGGCVAPSASIELSAESLLPDEPDWWKPSWAWPPTENPPGDYPTCRPKEWPATAPQWLTNIYGWPYPTNPCFEPSRYCVERTYTSSQVISLLGGVGISGVSFDGTYFTIPPSGRTLEQVRDLIEEAGVTIGELEAV